MDYFDIGIIGAGAAGMMSAAVAGQLGAKVVLIDHSAKLAEKIRISGGGRCNFTNQQVLPHHYLSAQPDFCRLALNAFQPNDFLRLLKTHRLTWHEKHKGQLFCDQSSEAIIQMLFEECERGHVTWRRPVQVMQITQQTHPLFLIHTNQGVIGVQHLMIATGGMSIPKIGATDFAFRIARQFQHRIIETRPGLVSLVFPTESWQAFKALSGLSFEARISSQNRPDVAFDEAILFTHKGLSGPGVLQISSYWQAQQAISINLLPKIDIFQTFYQARAQSKQKLSNYLNSYFPQRFVSAWLAHFSLDGDKKIAEMSNHTLRDLADSLAKWQLFPQGTEGYRKAEVTCGGVDTHQLDAQSMMSRQVPNLYFIGEAVDVTGWLGGYNFHWAWASGFVAARAAAQSV